MIDVNKILEEAKTTINCDYAEIYNIEDYRNRRLYLNDDIDECSAQGAVYDILHINLEDRDIPVDERKPIILYCTSQGGSVDDGFGVIDIIENSKTPVYTVNLAYQYSMGFLIGLAGKKRYAMPNAKFLMHDGSTFAYDSVSKAHDRLRFEERQEKRIKSYVLSHSKLTEEQYDQNYRVELYTFADEAKKYGFTDYIIGVDCDLGEVL